MKTLIISHSAVVPLYREKFQRLVQMGCEAHLVLPLGWPEGGRYVSAPPAGKEKGVHIHRLAARFIGKVGGFHLRRLQALVGRVKPDLIHVEEEPYSLAAWQALRISRKNNIPFVFFTWENILRSYKFPLKWIDQWVLHHSKWAIAGNREAESVLAQRGFNGHCTVIPQYGVDPEIFRPYTVLNIEKPVFTIGYFGRLCEEKGILTLFRAVEELNFSWRLIVTGSGSYASVLKQKAKEAGLEKHITFMAAVENNKMPKALQQLDVLVLPSETRSDWKEQFGRVLVEAMACAIPVIGSNCGEIPHVIGEAGLIFPEKDWKSLANRIKDVYADPRQAMILGQKGRERVLNLFTTEHIAQQTFALYQSMLERM